MINKILRVALVLLSISSLSYSQTTSNDNSTRIVGTNTGKNPIVTAVPFLTITPDARAAGMGEAGVATSTDPNSIYWNPSKMAFAKEKIGASISYTPWLQKLVGDMSLSYLSGFYRLNSLQTVGLSLRYFDLGSMQFTDENANVIQVFNPREFSLDGSFAMKLSDRFSMGIAARYIYSNLSGSVSTSAADTRPGQTAAADISAFYKNEDLNIAGYPLTLALGANISNIGPKITYTNDNQQDFIPTNLRIGTALTTEIDAYNKFTLAFDINKLLVPTPPIYDDQRNIIAGKDPNRSLASGIFGSFNDAPGGFSEEMQELVYAVGAEYWYSDFFAARGGYFHEHANKGNRQYFTVGLGLRYSKFGIDFAYLIATQRQHPLEDTLRFSLLFKFGDEGQVANPDDQPTDL